MFKLYKSALYGNPDLYSNFSRVGSDSEAKFLKNIKDQPRDWVYRTKEITYKRNSYGHRCAEPEALNDFILFTGCSITDGISLALEDTYPYCVSKAVGLDYYNLSLNGFGIDMLSLNLANWFKHIKLRPKVIVIQWPQPHRKFELMNNTAVPIGPWNDKTDSASIIPKDAWNAYEKVVSTNYMEHYFNVLQQTTLAYLNALAIPVIEINNFEKVDTGRDLTHPGVKSHELISNSLTIQVSKILDDDLEQNIPHAANLPRE